MKKEYVIAIQGALAAAGAFLSDKLGILYPVLCVLNGDDGLRLYHGHACQQNRSY